MKTGILGGTFNPIHSGHLILAENTFNELGLDKILFMPSGVSYLKKQDEIVSTLHRINMVKLAIEDNNHFELSTIETDRKGNTYTFETLEALKSQNTQNELYFIGGADTLMNIENWKMPDLIFKNAKLVIAPRNFLSLATLYDKAEDLKRRFNAAVIILNTPDIEISSTALRNNIKNKLSVKELIPNKVIEYIKANRLYED